MNGVAPLRPTYWYAIYATAFFTLSTEGAIGIVLPLLLIQLQAPPQILGLLVAMGALGPLLLSLPAGVLCDRYGDRVVLLGCAVGSLVTTALYPIAAVFWAIGLLQLAGGTVRSVGWMASQSYATRHSTVEERAKRVGYMTFSANLGMLITPAAIGLLVNRFDARAGFIVLAFWSLATIAAVRALPKTGTKTSEQILTWRAILLDPYRGAMRMALRPEVTAALIGTFLRLSTIALSQSFYPVYLHQAGYSAATIGVLFSTMFFASTIAAPCYGFVTRWVSGAAMIWISGALSILGICLVTLHASIVYIGVMTVIHGLGIGLSLPTLLSELAARTAAHERGLAVALRTVFNRLGYLIAPILLGISVAGIGLAPSFYVAGAVMGTILVAGMIFDRLYGEAAPMNRTF